LAKKNWPEGRKNRNQSIYLDIYVSEKREYEFLKLYIIPEHNKADKEANANVIKLANAIKSQKIVELQNNQHGFSSSRLKSKLKWCLNCAVFDDIILANPMDKVRQKEKPKQKKTKR
jgi:ribosomal protein S26